MTRAQMLRMIKRLVDARLQALAVDANMHDQYRATYSQAVAASKERKQLKVLLVALPEALGAAPTKDIR
jgi:hypothetical protein